MLASQLGTLNPKSSTKTFYTSLVMYALVAHVAQARNWSTTSLARVVP